MGYYLLEHRNPNGDHFYRTRRRPLLAIVVHVTAGLEDLDGVDDQSAENTARYAATTDRAVSWHSGSDADSWVDLLPYSHTAFHCVDYNSVTAGHEISKRHVDWTVMSPAWVDRTLRVAAVGPDGRGGLAKKARDNGIPLRRATKAELDRAIAAGGPPVGFLPHYKLDPARRTDPGRTFPWSRFLALMIGSTVPTPGTEEDLMAALTDAEQRELLTNSRAILAQFDPRNPGGLRDALVRTGQRLAAVQTAVDDQGDDETKLSAAIKAEFAAALADLHAALDELDAPTPTPQGA